jgi:Xaa-Pro aminopeptidase
MNHPSLRFAMKNSYRFHRERRAALAASMREHSGGGLALVPTAPEVPRNRDSLYPYRPDSYFYYLSGFPEPEAVVAIVASPDGDRHILFCREKNEEREIWDGFRYGPDAAREIFGFDEAHAIGELDAKMPDLACDKPALFTPLGLFESWDRRVTTVLNEVRARVRTGVSAPDEVVDVRGTLDAMRLVKDAQEADLMRRAGAISSGAHRRAMERTRPGWYEYQAEAEVVHEFLQAGALAVAYPSIVASGPNACVLHYRDNNRQMSAGELLLIDAGCEYQGYASDITRTFPVSGKFTGPQKDVYELVLASQLACLDAVKPGAEFHDYHKVAERVLAQGYLDLGLLEGTLDGVLESGSYKRFYMHRAGHWLGMDVHDAGLYQVKGASQKLRPGMVLTVEPGTYIRPADNVPEAFWNIGVRIEDDVMVTEQGHENLTASTPKTVADVEAACTR